METTFLKEIFPSELMEYFIISQFQVLCSVKDKLEYWLIDFEEKNELPNGYTSSEYESKGFYRHQADSGFSDKGQRDLLRIHKRRWRHKQDKTIIQRDFSFITDGLKFTQELSDFLNDATGYATRYHHQYSELFPGE